MDIEYTITITDEDGTEQDYEILLTFELEDTEYAALIPAGEEEPDEVMLYRYWEEFGEPRIEEIDDDEEFEMVSDCFSQILEQI